MSETTSFTIRREYTVLRKQLQGGEAAAGEGWEVGVAPRRWWRFDRQRRRRGTGVLLAQRERDETVKHLFLECRFARVVLSIIYVTSSLSQPHSVSNMFGNQLRGTKREVKR